MKRVTGPVFTVSKVCLTEQERERLWRFSAPSIKAAARQLRVGVETLHNMLDSSSGVLPATRERVLARLAELKGQYERT